MEFLSKNNLIYLKKKEENKSSEAPKSFLSIDE